MTVGSVEEANALNLYAIATNSPAKGAAATAASTPVNIASDQVVPVKEADGANATLGSKSDTAGANAAVANQTAQSRLAGIWTVLGSLTDAAAAVWDNTSNSISSLLRGIGGLLSSCVSTLGTLAAKAVTVQFRKERIVVCELTRTADAYTYAPTQIWRAAASGFDSFNTPVGLVNGDAVTIVRARLIKSTNVVAGAAFSCYLHTTAINAADKAVMNLAYANNALRAAKIDFPFMQIEGAASDCCMGWGFFPQQTEVTHAICDPADTMLYPRIVVEGPYVATASEKLYLELTVR